MEISHRYYQKEVPYAIITLSDLTLIGKFPITDSVTTRKGRIELHYRISDNLSCDERSIPIIGGKIRFTTRRVTPAQEITEVSEEDLLSVQPRKTLADIL